MKRNQNSRLCPTADVVCSSFIDVKTLRLQQLVFLALLLATLGLQSAPVDPEIGYTNSFTSQPLASDWAAFSRAGGGGDAYDMDVDVNANITAAAVTNQTVLGSGDPATANPLALWSSTGFLETRPTQNRYTALIGKFVNNTGTNATQISLSYLFTIAGTGAAEDAGLGLRVYYSLTGALNSWTNLPALNTTASTASSDVVATNLALNWRNGTSLYLMWVDDNALNGTDVADEFDNLSLQVTAGSPPVLTGTVIAPANSAALIAGASVTASTFVENGTGPYTVRYFMSSGAGNTSFNPAGSSGTAPYTVDLGALSAGTYNIYAAVTDSASTPATVNSVTNTFFVVNPLSIALTGPADGAIFDNTTSVTASSTVSGGTTPYSVQFFLDGLPNGAPITSAPYERNLGVLFVGDHTLGASVTDGRGWISNSLPRSVHITGPLGVDLVPTNGTSLNFGQPVVLTALPGGGAGPYAVTFLTNGQPAGSINSAPYALNLGILPVGTYTASVNATDSSAPAQQASSSVNSFSVVPNPILVTLTTPTNGQSAAAGQPFAMNATASVNAPVAVTNIDFFLDGTLVGSDSTTPYSASVANPAIGIHAAYAVAADSLGRKTFSITNQVSFVASGPPANDSFINAFILTGPIVSTVGYNNFATKQFGQEPTFIDGNFGGASVWWNWTASGTGLTTIDTFGSDFNTLLGVFTGATQNALTLVAQNNDYNGNSWSRVQFQAEAGTTYRIMVDGFRNGGGPGSTVAQGNIRLNIQGVGGFTIDTPTNGMVFTLGDPIPMSVSIQSDFPNPPATRVDFYLNGNLFASTNSAPFTATATGLPAGSNNLYVVVYDAAGTPIQSSPVSVLVQNVGVTLLTPVEGTTFLRTDPISISAWAYLPGGTIASVDFFVDGQKIGEDTAAPFSMVWSNVVGGSHRLTAVGHSDTGGSYNSQPINIAVATTLIAANSIWNYLDDGSDQGVGWIAPDFGDGSWASGPAPLGYSDSNGRFPATTNSFGPDPNAKYITTYFRQAFTANNAASHTNLVLNIQRDDGAVLYLNGHEFSRLNMPTNTAITSTTFAAANAGDDGGTTFTVAVNPEFLVEGRNVMAVEIHQDALNSSDIWFVMEMLSVPPVIRNQFPVVSITNIANEAYFVTPSSISIQAEASDPDGTVNKVEFFADGVKLGESATAPYSYTWNNPSTGIHRLVAKATDDQSGVGSSKELTVIVYDAIGTPVVEITNPRNGAVMEGPTNLLIRATAYALNGVTNVEFLANGAAFGNATSVPYTAIWPSSFLSNGLVAVASDVNGLQGASALVSVVITIPPTNTVAPNLATITPAPGSLISNLTSIRIIFSERVQNVDASDLLISGLPATNVVGSGSNYLFTFPQPPYGEVELRFSPDHGITDFGWPTVLAFNDFDPSAQWEYDLIDRTAPTITARTPAAGVIVTNLQQVSVTFSEPVSGVDAGDLLVNGTPAFGVSGGGANYIFSVSQPNSGTVNVSWATNHGIQDIAEFPNRFIGTGANAVWTFTLDARTTLIQSNASWQFQAGTGEASSPTNAWRMTDYEEGWPVLPAPFFYGDPYTNATISGTYLSQMASNYSSIYLRHYFTLANRNGVTNLLMNVQCDDGFVAWINGTQVARVNVPAGELSYTNTAVVNVSEPGNVGAAYILYTLTNAASYLRNGNNVLAIHAFNQSKTNVDFGFNAQLYAFLPNNAFTAPRIVQASPAQGELFYLTNITVAFNEGITNVDAGDLLINGVAAASVATTNNAVYIFAFPQPPYGPVAVTWASGHGIVDFDDPPKPFPGDAAASRLNYTLLNPSSPRISSQIPLAGTTVTGLTQITIVFNEPVTGIDAADLLINNTPASSLSSPNNTTFIFSFPQPSFGPIAIRWAANNGITDIEQPANGFDPVRFGAQWDYLLVDPIPTVTLTSPANNSAFLIGSDVIVRASASDNDGEVTKIELFEGSNKIGEGSESPFEVTWPATLEGSYKFRAVATDDSGLSRTSAPVSILVVTSLPIALLRGPYLQVGTPTSGIIRWRTDLESDSVIHYGTDADLLTNVVVDSSQTNEHVIQISGLEIDTKYYYSIGSSAQPLASGTDYWFKTSPIPGRRKSTRIWALGDSGTANQNARNVRDAYYAFAATNGPANIWLMLGDNAYNSGLDTEYQAAVFNMYPDTLRNLFLWPTIGNHESAQAFTAADFPYLHIFTLPKNGEAGGIASGSPRYYSFDYAHIHFICLDSMTSGRTTNTAMVQWLVNDLAAATAEWTIAFFHHPPYTRGNHNSDAETELIEIRQNVLPILEANGVDLVLCGHSHDLERSYLLHGHYGLSSTLTSAMKIDGGSGREDGSGAYRKNSLGQGVVYTVAGSSGQITGGQLNHPAHFISINELGSLVIDVNDNRLDVRFLATNGVSRDYFTILRPELPPIAIGGSVTLDEDTQATLTLAASEPNGIPLTYTIMGAPINGTAWIVGAGGSSAIGDGSPLGSVSEIFYRPNSNFHGADSVTFKVNNGKLDSSMGRVSITVRPVNDAPVADASATPLRSIISANNVNAVAVLDGSRSSDIDEDTLQFHWRENWSGLLSQYIATGMVTSVTLPVGVHNIVLDVSDGLVTASDGLTIEIIGGTPTIQPIIDLINGSVLVRKNSRPLMTSLEQAGDSMNRGSAGAAVNQLQAFQNKVRAQVLPFDPALANQLIALAQSIIDSIGDPGPKPKLTMNLQPNTRTTRMKFAGNGSRAYVVEASTDLVHWQAIGTAKYRGYGEFQFDDSAAAGQVRFYRVRMQ
jgi:hypothetical protein